MYRQYIFLMQFVRLQNLACAEIIQRCMINIKVLKMCMLSNQYIYATND